MAVTDLRKDTRPDEPAPIIQVRGLKNAFGTQLVHDGLDLDVRRGEIIGVVGGSGTGKSVLMRSIIGLQTPVEGEITVFGESMIGRPEEEAKHVRRRWGILFQGSALFSTLTVAENVQVPIREYFPRMDETLLAEIAAYKIAMSGLAADAGPKFPSELSGGMRKRAGIARALALDPELLFLDEPTAGLDPIGAAAFDDLINELRDALGLTVFLITHDLDTLYAICDRVAVLADRRVVAIGTIPELLALDHAWIQEYFRGPRGRAAATVDKRERASA
jgi:phospholipid/cholesterol/gamma-HCH transport system ATP-binding protein